MFITQKAKNIFKRIYHHLKFPSNLPSKYPSPLGERLGVGGEARRHK